MTLADVLLGWLRPYRRLRGGRWEQVSEHLVIGSVFWARVDLPTPSRMRMGETIVAREDWRR